MDTIQFKGKKNKRGNKQVSLTKMLEENIIETVSVMNKERRTNHDI